MKNSKWKGSKLLFFAIGAVLITVLFIIKRTPTATKILTRNEVVRDNSTAENSVHQEVPVLHAQSDVEAQIPKQEQGPLPHKAVIHQGDLPSNFPRPNRNENFSYKVENDKGTFKLSLPDGRRVVLDSPEIMKMPKSEMTEEMRSRTLDEKLKDPDYKKRLKELGAKIDDNTTFFDWRKSLYKIASLFGLGSVHAKGEIKEAVFLSDLVTLNPNGDFRSQEDRGTCSYHSVLAGIESTYLRDYGVALDLSEQFANHINLSTVPYLHADAKIESRPSLILDSSDLPSLLRKLEQYSVPLESYAPYWLSAQKEAFIKRFTARPERYKAFYPGAGDQEWIDAMEYSEEYVSQTARDNAIYRISKNGYTLLSQNQSRNTSLIEGYLKARQPVVIAVYWMFKVENGLHVYDPAVVYPKDEVPGHGMLIVGFVNTGDKNSSHFIVKNSWGKKDYLLLSYAALEVLGIYGGVVEKVVSPNSPAPFDTQWLGKWHVDNDGWRGALIVRRIENNVRTGTFYTPEDKIGRPVNAKISNNGQTLTYYIFDDWNVAGNKYKGQPFTLHFYGWTKGLASGNTVWNKKQYGMHASRLPLEMILRGHPPTGDHSHWLGNWNFNLDGRSGQLKLIKSTPKGSIEGYFISPGRKAEAVLGQQVKDHPHLIDLTIGRTNLRLMRFTREHGRAAGITKDKRSFGLHAEWLSDN